MKQRLHDSKAVFRDLTISELRFEELKRSPESALSLKDFVCMKTHEVVARFKKQAENARQEAEAARRAITR